RTYVERWSFKHPGTADFFAVAREVSGRDLGDFERQYFHGTATLDYAVTGIECGDEDPEAARGVMDDGKGGHLTRDPVEPSPERSVHRCHVMVERLGTAVAPVTVQVELENSSRLEEHWDGQEGWHRFAFAVPG